MKQPAQLEGRALTPNVVEIDAALESLRVEWLELWGSCPRATPFQHPDWVLACRRNVSPGPLIVIVIRSADQRLVSLAPFFVHDDGTKRKLLLLGSGISDYLELLSIPEVEHDAAAMIYNVLADLEAQWDLCELQQLREDSPFLTSASDCLRSCVAAHEPCPVMDLSIDIPQPYQKRIDYYARHAAKLGHIEFTASSKAEDLPLVFDLHESLWTTRADHGVLSDPALRRMHIEAVRGMSPSGIARMYFLHVAGKPAAAYYGFVHRGVHYYYIGGFDPEFEKFNLGTLLVMHAIHSAKLEGGRRFDFLRGREPYKYRWGAEDQHTFLRTLRPTARGK